MFAVNAIFIPKSVAKLGYNPFMWCSNLKRLFYNAENCISESNSLHIGNGGFMFIVEKDVQTLQGFCDGEVSQFILQPLTPPVISNTLASTVGTNTPVYVPSAAYADYWQAEGWCNFTNLISISNPITNIQFNESDLSISIGSHLSLSKTITPSNATINTLKWTSSDERIVAVDADGNITGLTEGEATITACAIDGSGVSATCTVKVERVMVESIQISQNTLCLDINGSAMLTCTILPANATSKDLEWITDDPGVVATKSGDSTNSLRILGLKKGTTTIKCRTTDGSELEASCVIAVGYDAGDMNNDGNVNIGDVTALINHILGNTPDNFIAALADINGDGNVNIGDVTALINKILTSNN